MALTGYMPEDLVLRRSFVQASLDALEKLARRLADEGAGDIAVVVGYCDRSHRPAPAVGRPAGEPQNAAALIWQGQVVTTYAKHHLPNYGVFDEFRYFVRGDRFPVFRLHGVDVGIVICEDLWQEGGPIAVARQAEVGLILCPNASPYERFKDDVRGDLVTRRAQEAGAAIAYVNMVGGQDELVYDGDSLVVTADGTLVARAPVWQEGLMAVDLDLPAATGQLQGSTDAGDGTTMLIDRTFLTHPAGAVLRAADCRHRRPAARRARGLGGAGHGTARLHPQERLQLRRARTVGRHRLRRGRGDRLRRPRS